ncbi:GAF domain-containing sensor histidine kinase [Natronolimnobius baerhuensis]|uniref:histidine kinase n=1 Tax=Natronolimnobius baerhuensis TaxID=253108 RepID=A0A202EAU1_9EURY|nr:GAF domain-containing sensor histidine kinase [Natronolimnobius baerhuensis]OVE85365.1 hypothetical protein B2G88_00610 [Natronolimnobius baerhuensis]
MAESPLGPDEARAELYEIMNDECSFETKADRALELGRRYLGVDNGHVTKIDEQSDYWKSIASTDPVSGRFPPGLALDLQTTYCRRTIRADEPIALNNVPEQGWADDPAYEAHGLKCYHGTTITLDDGVYGTVCFVSTDARSEPFSSDETMFAELIARLLEHELERKRTEIRLEHLDTFASVVSHDLRSPLTVIQGWTEMAEESGDVELLAHVHPAVDRMQHLLEDVLQAARNGQIVQEVRPMPLSGLAWAAWDTIETGPHDLVVETDAVVRAGPERLQALLENLFRNAVEHGAPDTQSELPAPADQQSLTISVTDLEDEYGRPDGFAVADTGVGIPADRRDSIFDYGYTTSSEGTGFGLAIVEAIVDAHEWSIALAEHEGESVRDVDGDADSAGDESGARFEIRGVDFQPSDLS